MFIILNSVIFFVQGIFYIWCVKIKTNFWIFDALLTLIFYYRIFKIKLYRHHYLSIGIIILTGTIIDIALGNLQNDMTEHF